MKSIAFLSFTVFGAMFYFSLYSHFNESTNEPFVIILTLFSLCAILFGICVGYIAKESELKKKNSSTRT